MSKDSDRSRGSTATRFGKLSKNMFFARHVPHPRYLKFITGTAGVQVCHVRDNVPHLPAQPTADLAKSLFSDPKFTIEFPPNSFNEALLRSYAERIQPKKRRERFLPPLPGWNVSGTFLVEDTEHWRRELTRIAEMVGLVTVEELAEIDPKKEINNLRRSPSAVSKLSEKTPLKSSFGEYSQRTGRWNETPKGLSRSRSLNRRTPLSAIVPNHLFCVDEQEREMWMLQVLCQILQTDSMADVQSWLVSATPSEKEAVRQLISTAIKGLEDNGRIHPTALLEEQKKSTPGSIETINTVGSNNFSSASTKGSVSSSLIAYQEQITRTPFRPQTAPQTQPTTGSGVEKSNHVLPPNLESIEEASETRATPIPAKVDAKRDVQVLTLNDTARDNPPAKKAKDDPVPF